MAQHNIGYPSLTRKVRGAWRSFVGGGRDESGWLSIGRHEREESQLGTLAKKISHWKWRGVG